MRNSRQKLPKTALVFLAACHSLVASTETFPEPNGETIIERLIENQSPVSEVAYISMKILKPDTPTKEYRILYVYLDVAGRDNYLLRMIRPQSIQNVTVLANENSNESFDQYVYLPAVGKSKRLGKNSRSQAFLDSDFTYEDLLREIPTEQSYTRLEDSIVSGIQCFTVKAEDPASKEDRAYQHRLLFIEKTTYNLIQTDFFGAGNKLLKTFYAFNYNSPEVRGETTRPQKAMMLNHEANTSTSFTVIEARLNKSIDSTYFTPEAIETWSDEAIEEFIFQMTIFMN